MVQGSFSNINFLIVGAGPAALCAVPVLLKAGVPAAEILWIDTHFKLGDFGTVLSHGSSVPGNTAVNSYRRVIDGIYKILPVLPCPEPGLFDFHSLDSNYVCPLKLAAAPFLHIMNQLEAVVPRLRGKVKSIKTCEDGFRVTVASAHNTAAELQVRRIILATGARPRKIFPPIQYQDIQEIPANTAFILSELCQFLEQQKEVKTVAVIGSSHSAALAAMHLLQLGYKVKQFLNKKYLFAAPAISSEGISFTQYDNTGLKGEVAQFTRTLLEESNQFSSKISYQLQQNSAAFNYSLQDCSHFVAAIGYEATPSLLVDGLSLHDLKHNDQSTEFHDKPGLFGIGIAFPQRKQALSGESELAVGIGKFWATVNDPLVLDAWLS